VWSGVVWCGLWCGTLGVSEVCGLRGLWDLRVFEVFRVFEV